MITTNIRLTRPLEHSLYLAFKLDGNKQGRHLLENIVHDVKV